MIEPTEIAIADIMKHPVHGLVSFQPSCDDKCNDKIVPVRNSKGKLFFVSLEDCFWPKKDEGRNFWKDFPHNPPEDEV